MADSPAVSAVLQSRQAADSSENTTTMDTTDNISEPEPKRCKFDTKDQPSTTLESKLEERLTGILCCAVCLDVPGLSMYQASADWSVFYLVR